MSTTGQIDATLARFNRKSPQDAYKQVCEELGVHYQREIFNLLPSVASAWHRVRTLELDNTLLGAKGAMALLPCILVSSTLRKITLKTTGITDEFVIELCNILQSHPSVRAVDISNNELVSVFSASAIISLMKNNSNMVGFEVKGTHMGDNVGNIIADLGKLNQTRVASYYTDNYFKLKNIFGYLDEDGQGWVPLKSLVMNCPYPILQEQFVERVAKMKPKKRSDNTISVNTFMSLVYMNYKTEAEIAQRAKQVIDEPYVFMVANWKQIMSAAERYNEENTVKVFLPQDLHRLRIKHFLLANDEADQVIQRAISIHESDRREHGDEVVEESAIHLDGMTLFYAYRESCGFAEIFRPLYQFYEERDPAYVPEAMRNGSRIFSLGSLPAMQSTSAMSMNSSPNGSVSQRGSEGGEESMDLPHTWSLAPSLVAMMVEFFNKVCAKLPKKKESVIVDSPRTKKDKAMEKSAIPIRELLDVSFETDFEIIKTNMLANFFAYSSLPVDNTTITLQEMVNVLDELYTEIGVDKVLTNKQLEGLENPFEVEAYAEFLAQHLLFRESIADQWTES